MPGTEKSDPSVYQRLPVFFNGIDIQSQYGQSRLETEARVKCDDFCHQLTVYYKAKPIRLKCQYHFSKSAVTRLSVHQRQVYLPIAMHQTDLQTIVI